VSVREAAQLNLEAQTANIQQKKGDTFIEVRKGIP
jgi:hypothetical protein